MLQINSIPNRYCSIPRIITWGICVLCLVQLTNAEDTKPTRTDTSLERFCNEALSYKRGFAKTIFEDHASEIVKHQLQKNTQLQEIIEINKKQKAVLNQKERITIRPRRREPKAKYTFLHKVDGVAWASSQKQLNSVLTEEQQQKIVPLFLHLEGIHALRRDSLGTALSLTKYQQQQIKELVEQRLEKRFFPLYQELISDKRKGNSHKTKQELHNQACLLEKDIIKMLSTSQKEALVNILKKLPAMRKALPKELQFIRKVKLKNYQGATYVPFPFTPSIK